MSTEDEVRGTRRAPVLELVGHAFIAFAMLMVVVVAVQVTAVPMTALGAALIALAASVVGLGLLFRAERCRRSSGAPK